MKTQEEIAQSARKNGISFMICHRTDRMAPPCYEVGISSAADGHCASSWFSVAYNGAVHCSDGYTTKKMMNCAERLLLRNSNLHACEWTNSRN